MLQEILSFEDKSLKTPKKSSSRIPTMKSSQNSLKTSRTLLEKLANISDSSIPSTSSSRSEKNPRASRIPSKIIKQLQNLETQTPKMLEKSQSIQTVLETKRQLSITTETTAPTSADVGISSDDLDLSSSPDPVKTPQITKQNDKQLVDVEISCKVDAIPSTPENEGNSKKILLTETSSSVKILKVIQTQTSRSFLLDCSGDNGEEKNILMGKMRLKLPCKEINTDKRILIDSATGKDRLEIQNFCCESQLTNTDAPLIYPINYVMKKDANHQVDAIRSLMNINADDSGGLKGEFDMCESIVSSISKELMSSRRSLIESCEKLSSEFVQKQEEIVRIPREVIRAFEIAEDRARNLCRAIEIYQGSLKKNEGKTQERCEGNESLEKILEQKIKEEELGVTNKIEKNFEENRMGERFMEDLKVFLMQQDVKLVVEEIVKTVDKRISKENLKKDEIRSCGVESSSEAVLMNRANILPIIYGALCSLVFWSLQFSMSCDMS
uniref:Zfp292 protein n=1 Tax=Fopius arisanus TaxID=64838 RepID=A0A0C9RWK8_9HYME